MTLTASVNDDDDIAEYAAQGRRHMSQHSLRQLRQSLSSLQQQQQQQQQYQLSTGLFPEAGGLIPESNNDGCLRFYKGLAGRDRRHSAAAAAAAARRSRRRWPEKRTRALVGSGSSCFWARHNCSEGDPVLATDFDLSSSVEPLPMPATACPASYDRRETRGGQLPVRTSTLDTRSSATSPSSEHSQGNNQIDNTTPKVRYIYYKGRLQPTEIMKWPEQPRIPASERYRMEEPMKQLYGKRSLFKRLLRAMEQSKAVVEAVDRTEIRGPIPLLPRRMAELTKSRLKMWYKPLESSGQFNSAA